MVCQQLQPQHGLVETSRTPDTVVGPRRCPFEARLDNQSPVFQRQKGIHIRRRNQNGVGLETDIPDPWPGAGEGEQVKPVGMGEGLAAGDNERLSAQGR